MISVKGRRGTNAQSSKHLDSAFVHGYDEMDQALGEAVLAYARERLSLDPVPLDKPRSRDALQAAVGETITASGLGGEAVMRLFTQELAPSCISTDHPRFLAFIPCAPTESSSLFDLVVGASSIYAGSWLEGAGAVFAENQALRWLADLAGFPAQAGGVFVPGGSVGNLSALVAARHRARERRRAADVPPPSRWAIVAGAHAHSSIASACEIMDVELLPASEDDAGRLTGAAVRAAVVESGHDGVFAVVGTGGTTNFGIVDDLASIADACADLGAWFHVDGAYGLAALVAPRVRDRFAGVERADSFVVDPHKWLFAPFDACALLYREPAAGLSAHTQKAGYLDVLADSDEPNPADYSVGLTRRARGLPFWFSLAVHGTDAYRRAVEATLSVARFAAEEISRREELQLLREPDLSVVVFRRVGWTPERYQEWSDRLLDDETAFVVPTTHEGETVTRFAIVNPRTTEADILMILDTMA